MKLVKWLLLAIVCLVVVPVAVLMLVLSNIDPNQFKPKLVEMVSEHTRGRLDIQGDIAWTFWPTVGVEVKRLMYRLPEDGDQPLAAVSHVVFGVAALPLLEGSLEVDSLRIDGVHLALERDADGRGNWERVMKAVAPEPSQSPADGEVTAEEAADENKAAENGGIGLNIAKIEILNTSLRYREPGRQLYLQDVKLQASDFNLAGGNFPLAVQFKLDASEPALVLQGNLDGTARMDAKTQRYELLPATIALNLSGAALGERTLPLTLDLRGGLDAKAGRLAIEKWSLAAATLRANGDFAIDALGAPEQAMTARIDAPAFALVDLLNAIGKAPVMSDANALKQVSLNARLAGDSRQLLLEDLKLGLDGSSLSGRAGISDLAKGTVLVELTGDKLDLDRYLPAANAASAAPQSPAPQAGVQTAATSTDAQIAAGPAAAPTDPLVALRTLKATLNLGLGEFKLNNLRMQELKLVQSADQGKLKTEQLQAKLYGGSLQATAVLDVAAEPALKIKHKLSGVQLKPLLADYKQYQQLEGGLDLTAELSAKGRSADAMLASLNGPLSLNVSNGRLLGVNLEQKLCEGVSSVRKQALASQWPAETRFSDLNAKLQFANGIGHSDRLVGGLPALKVTGAGDFDLPKRLVDLALGLRLTGQLNTQDPACEINERLQAVEWPVRCQGPLDGDTGKLCQLDQSRMEGILKDQLKSEAKRKLKKKIDKLDPKAKEKLNKLLPGLAP